MQLLLQNINSPLTNTYTKLISWVLQFIVLLENSDKILLIVNYSNFAYLYSNSTTVQKMLDTAKNYLVH